MKRKAVFFTCLAAALMGAVLLLLDQRVKPGAASHRSIANSESMLNTVPPTPVQTSVNETQRTPTKHDQMVISPSLEGTDIDGALRADADGHLILDIGVRDFFDYFLSTADEIGAENAIDEVVRYIQTYLPEQAQAEAIALFENYLRFKRYEFGVHQTPITDATLNDAVALKLLRENLDLLKTHRQTLFNTAQERALFGLEDVYADHTLSSLSIMADESMSEAQKHTEIAQLQQDLPPQLQASMLENRNGREHQKTIETQVASSLDDSQLHQSLLDQGIEQHKADEIVEYRQQQRWFDSNYEAYAGERAALDPEDSAFTTRVEQLQSTYFVTPEQKTQAKLRDLREE